MKCPVCKTEVSWKFYCPECGFEQINSTFLSFDEAEYWEKTEVLPYRVKYLESLKDFNIKGTKLIKYNGKKKELKVPYGVTEIGHQAFWYNHNVEKVDLPTTVNKIDRYAFATKAGVPFSINIPANLYDIDDRAFAISQLKTFRITIEENTRYKVIENCLIDTVQHRLLTLCGDYIGLPKCKINKICPTSMSAVNEIETLVIPEGVIEMGSACFGFNVNLTDVVLPSTLRAIESNPFRGCRNLTEIKFERFNPAFSVYKRFLVDNLDGRLICSLGEHVHELPDSIKRIGFYSLYQKNIGDCIIPKGVTEVSALSFSATKGNSLFIPKTVRSVGYNAFDESEIRFICCEIPKCPLGWDDDWLGDCNAKVIWGVTMDDYERFYLH